MFLPKWAQLVLMRVSLFSESVRGTVRQVGVPPVPPTLFQALGAPSFLASPPVGQGSGSGFEFRLGGGPLPPEPLVNLFFIASILYNVFSHFIL